MAKLSRGLERSMTARASAAQKVALALRPSRSAGGLLWAVWRTAVAVLKRVVALVHFAPAREGARLASPERHVNTLI